jgi:hypothetical protein
VFSGRPVLPRGWISSLLARFGCAAGAGRPLSARIWCARDRPSRRPASHGRALRMELMPTSNGRPSADRPARGTWLPSRPLSPGWELTSNKIPGQVHSGRLHKRAVQTSLSQLLSVLRPGPRIMQVRVGLRIHRVIYRNARGLYVHNTNSN